MQKTSRPKITKSTAALLLAVWLFAAFGMSAFAAAGAPPAEAAAEEQVSPGDVASGADVSPGDAPPEGSDPISGSDTPPVGVMRGISAEELIRDMKLGISLGHSLDSWSSDAGYKDYYNCNAYQAQARYTDGQKKGRQLQVSDPVTFKADGTCTVSWNTDNIITSKENTPIGELGFTIINYTINKPVEIMLRVKKATLVKKSGKVINFDDLTGDMILTISRYGTVNVCTTEFPSNMTMTGSLKNGTLTIEFELIEYPQKEYTKVQYFEGLWNNPLTDPVFVDEMKKAGFNTVRVPVTYFNHINPDTGVIDAEWLGRVAEVVDYVLKNDMYCVINMQNDSSTSGWLRVEPDEKKSPEIIEKYISCWKQISEKFKDYSDYLIFEGYNELTDTAGHYTNPGEEAVAWVNELAQTFVDTVRASGGNNDRRFLLVAPYAASCNPDIMAGFNLPNDPAGRTIVSLHVNEPASFALSVGDVTAWGTDEDKSELDKVFGSINSAFMSKGVPVVITAFSSAAKENTGVGTVYGEVSSSDAGEDVPPPEEDEPIDLFTSGSDAKPKNTEDRVRHAEYYTKKADEYNIACIWWDDGGFFDRETLTWNYPELVDVMVNAVSTHVNRLTIQPIGQQYTAADYMTPITPEVVITGGGAPLTEGVDYTLSFMHNTEPGTATVIITGMGDYTGVTTTTFELVKPPAADPGGFAGNPQTRDANLSMLTFSLPIMIALIVVYLFQRQQRKAEEARRALVVSATEEARREIEELDSARPQPRKVKSKPKVNDEFDDLF